MSDGAVLPEQSADTASANHGPCEVSDGRFDICWDENSYATCTNGEWVVRACASGTVCQDNDGSVMCGWADDA